MPKVIVYGASGTGRRFVSKMGDRYEIVAFCDSDDSKHGTFLLGHPVISPKAALSQYFDFVVVASIWQKEIKELLLGTYGLEAEQIIIPPKNILKHDRPPFECEVTRDLARKMLLFLADQFEQNGIEYFVDHGTLLGLVRDGDIMPWDDDIDISVPAKYRDQCVSLYRRIINKLPLAAELKWESLIWRYEASGQVLGLNLYSKNFRKFDFSAFKIGLFFQFFNAGRVDQYINTSPEKYFLSSDLLGFGGQQLRIPAHVEEYLEMHYGDWRTPKKNISFSDINNFVEPKDRIFGEYLVGGHVSV